MTMPPPSAPKIYHIAHVNRLPSIITEGSLLCDAEIVQRAEANQAHGMGTKIGMDRIKKRRLDECTLNSYPDLSVGQCVPFYFCPRPVMLYVLHCANHPELTYRGGQEPIIHLEADLMATVQWADRNEHRWVFTLSNAGTRYFEDRDDLAQLGEINWDAVRTNRWAGGGISQSIKEGQQAEFLLERSFPWHLVAKIGVFSQKTYRQAKEGGLYT